MSHFLVWKEHYRPNYNYLTLAFCVLTVKKYRFRLVKIIVFVLLALLSTEVKRGMFSKSISQPLVAPLSHVLLAGRSVRSLITKNFPEMAIVNTEKVKSN